MKLTQILNESSLSRLWQYMEKHDCGTMSAFRSAADCGKGEKYTYRQNMQRNASLLSKIHSSGRYSVTAIKGAYIENYGTPEAVEVSENTFFIADVENKGNLLSVMKRLGEEFEQDSILFIPVGGQFAELHGTNHCPSGYPGYGKIVKFDKREFGREAQFFSKVGNRPFSFLPETVMTENVGPNDYHGKWACHTLSKKHWSEFEV